jgi:hypothetical protein
MTGMSGLILSPSVAMGKAGPSFLGLPGTKVDDAGVFRAG